MFQNVPEPSTANTKMRPDVLYWPVMRNSGMDNLSFIVIASGLALKIDGLCEYYSGLKRICYGKKEK